MRIFHNLCILFLGLFLLSGCSTSEPSLPQETKISIGWLGPLSGPQSTHGSVAKDHLINALRPNFSLEIYDSSCEVQKANIGAHTLINIKKVEVLIAFCPSDIVTAGPVAHFSNIPVISLGIPKDSFPNGPTHHEEQFHVLQKALKLSHSEDMQLKESLITMPESYLLYADKKTPLSLIQQGKVTPFSFEENVSFDEATEAQN